MKICSIDNCDKKVAYKGMCSTHWKQDLDANRVGTCSRYAENEIKLFENYAHIYLYDSRGNILDRAVVDLEDIERVRKYVWTVKICKGKLRYAINTKVGRLHHFVMRSKERFDHIDTNGLNNRKSNLRPAEQIQNTKNMSKGSRNTSGAKGVSLKKSGVLEVRIMVNGKQLWLGSYRDKIKAAIAYNEAAVKYHGEFASLNNIEELTAAQNN